MIQRKTQFVTQNFNPPHHKGIDLRCVNEKYKLQPVIAPEIVEIVRIGTDGYGNKFVVYKSMKYEFKSIHVDCELPIGKIVLKNEFIGLPVMGGNSKALHEHFEIWQNNKPIDPLAYFDENSIKYERKT